MIENKKTLRKNKDFIDWYLEYKEKYIMECQTVVMLQYPCILLWEIDKENNKCIYKFKIHNALY